MHSSSLTDPTLSAEGRAVKGLQKRGGGTRKRMKIDTQGVKQGERGSMLYN